jgi:cell division protein FtsL
MLVKTFSYLRDKARIQMAQMQIFLFVFLIGSLFSSALAVIYFKHLNRQLFSQLQQQQQQIEALQIEWTQLLLEQGTWASEARVERLAQQHLKMRLPEPNEVVVITR